MAEPTYHDVEGTGGGFGRYAGLPPSEIKIRFDACRQDPSMRSISAILRITREQIESRGQLGVYPKLTWIAVVVVIIAVAVRFLGPKSFEELSTKAALGSGTAFFLLLVSTLPTHHARKANQLQEDRIHQMATDAIVEILKSNPTLKPLNYEQELTVKLLIKKTKGGTGLKQLL